MSETQTAASTGRQLAPIEVLKNQLARRVDEFRVALPSHITPEKFQRVAATAANANPSLLSADRGSLLNACMKAAQDGLLPDGREAALVIYGQQVQYLPMIGGLLKKARNSGELKSISAKVIYKNDTFRYWVDDEGEHLEHTPQMFGDAGPAIGAYAMAKTKDGGLFVAVLSKEKIEQHRAASRSAQKGPWVQWWDEMAEKTALKVLLKRLPASSDMDGLQSVIEADEAHYDYDRETGEVVEPAPAAQPAAAAGRRRPSRLDKVANAPEPAAPPVTDAEVEYPDEERDAIMDVEREAETGVTGAAAIEGDVI